MSIGSLGAQARGRVIRLIHNDPDINNAIESGFDQIVFERSTDGGITFSEFLPRSERPKLEVDKVDYTLIDRFGAPEYFYRVKYIDVKTGECSDPSKEVEGSGLALLNVLSVAQLKQRYLFGIDLTDDAGNPLPESVFEHYILTGIEILETELDIPILPTTFEEEMHDYYRNDYSAFTIIQLDNYPVISVEALNVQYPSGQNVVTFPNEWLRIDKNHGIIRVVPTAGTLSEILVGAGGSYLPAIYNGMSHLPDLFSLDYTAGFEDCMVPRNLVDIIGKLASLGPFNIFGDLIAGAGIATLSLSIDGLSQNIGTTSSATNAGYGARLGQYTKEIKDQIPKLRKFYKGIRMTVM